MAESHEPSYYEIALTNRQVVVAFIILLVCLLSAFFSGVWIGREGNAARMAENQVVRDTPPASKEGQSLEELAFFDDRNPNPTANDATEAPKPPQPRTGSTLVEDLSPAPAPADADEGFEATDETLPAEEPAVASKDDDRSLSKAERRARRQRAREEAEEAAAAAKPKPAPAPTRTAQAEKAPSVPKGSVVIQVFSSPDKAQADRIRSRLASGGYSAFLSPVEKAGHTMYRVRVGPFSSRDDAQKVAEKVRKGYQLDTWVTE